MGHLVLYQTVSLGCTMEASPRSQRTQCQCLTRITPSLYKQVILFAQCSPGCPNVAALAADLWSHVCRQDFRGTVVDTASAHACFPVKDRHDGRRDRAAVRDDNVPAGRLQTFVRVGECGPRVAREARSERALRAEGGRTDQHSRALPRRHMPAVPPLPPRQCRGRQAQEGAWVASLVFLRYAFGTHDWCGRTPK